MKVNELFPMFLTTLASHTSVEYGLYRIFLHKLMDVEMRDVDEIYDPEHTLAAISIKFEPGFDLHPDISNLVGYVEDLLLAPK